MFMKKPSKLNLAVYGEVKASHSLEGFEVPHFHLWKVEASFEAAFPLKTDRLIDLVYLQKILSELFAPIEGRYFNEVFSFSPTSENFCAWIWEELSKKIPDAPLHSVSVTLCDLEGRATGQARLLA